MAAKTAEVLQESETAATTSLTEKTIGIRVSPNNYFVALFLLTFASGLLVYLERETWALFLFGAGWTIFPFLAWNDRIVFDGKRLSRAGFLPRLWAKINRSKYRIKIGDIEQIETQSLRALKRGGTVFYRYRTTVLGKGARVRFASGGEDYRQMVRAIFSLAPENALDNRSIELRDFLREPKETLMKAEFARIPSAEVLENSFAKSKKSDARRRAKQLIKQSDAEELEKADYLHALGNELRLGGYLLQSLEAFRRALFLHPKDARLLFDFARALHSYAGAERNASLTRKSFAALRLAERNAGGDAEMLARIGECYFQYGDPNRARAAFQKSIAASKEENNFRAVRGLAEIALRDGKIAHVIQQFTIANRLAEAPALRRWTQNEIDYFSRLNGDDEYMEMEISRVNLLENLERAKKTCLQIALLSFPAIVIGVTLEETTMANVGWAISALALLVWLAVIAGANIFSSRIPLDFEEDE